MVMKNGIICVNFCYCFCFRFENFNKVFVSDSKILIKIYLLFSLLLNKSSKIKVGKNFFKPIQVESQEVVLHVKVFNL